MNLLRPHRRWIEPETAQYLAVGDRYGRWTPQVQSAHQIRTENEAERSKEKQYERSGTTIHLTLTTNWMMNYWGDLPTSMNIDTTG